MKTLLFFYLIGLTLTVQASWQDKLKAQKINQVHICGNDRINLNKSSLKKDFVINGKAYVFSGLIDYKTYWKILGARTADVAKKELKQILDETVLWEIAGDKIRSLGKPLPVEFVFKVSIKDCIDTGKNNYGHNCSKNLMPKNCCSEKFPSFRMLWKDQGKEFRLMYAPDPSIRLKVPGEINHRYCQAVRPLKLK